MIEIEEVLDLKASIGDVVKAAADGEVVEVSENSVLEDGIAIQLLSIAMD